MQDRLDVRGDAPDGRNGGCDAERDGGTGDGANGDRSDDDGGGVRGCGVHVAGWGEAGGFECGGVCDERGDPVADAGGGDGGDGSDRSAGRDEFELERECSGRINANQHLYRRGRGIKYMQ